MRDTVLCLTDALDEQDRDVIRAAVVSMVEAVAAYVPGYRLKQEVQFAQLTGADVPNTLLGGTNSGDYCQVSVFLEVEGAAHYLPAYAGNLDIMTSAAVRVAEEFAARRTRLFQETTL